VTLTPDSFLLAGLLAADEAEALRQLEVASVAEEEETA
jgi:hypothetical protein